MKCLIALGIGFAVIIIGLIIGAIRASRRTDKSYPQLTILDKYKISKGVHAEYVLDKRTKRVRLMWDRQTYLLPDGGSAKDHYPLTDEEYEQKLKAEAGQKRREEALRIQQEKVAKYPLLVTARAAGHDVCFDCGTVDPPRCYYCGTECMVCDGSSMDECRLCDSSD